MWPTVARTAPIVQERTIAENLRDEFAHSVNPHDRVLNTAQLRSSEIIRQFRTPRSYPGLPLDAVIQQAIAQKKALDQAASEQQAKRGERKRVRLAKRQAQDISEKSQQATTSSSVLESMDPQKKRRIQED